MITQHDTLTIQQIIDAFPDECEKLLPREIRRIKSELKPYYDHLQSIVDAGYDIPTYQFAMKVADGNKPKATIDILNRLQAIRQAFQTPKEGAITPHMIQIAKERQILPLYAFERVKTGTKRWSASCPWHSDKTPSFTVYNGTSFHCFSCQESGDSIAFYMKISGVSFPQAVRFLCNQG